MKSLIIASLVTLACGERVAEENQDKTYSLALNEKSELPECTEDNEKQLVLIKQSKTFYSCEDESWVKLHRLDSPKIDDDDDYDDEIAHEIVSKPEKNSPSLKAETEEKGQNCSNGGLKIVIEEKAHYICNGNEGINGLDGKDGVDGIDGEHGTNGRDGIDGTAGANGSDGSNGIDGLNGTSTKVFDANDNHIGYLVDFANYMIMFPDGKMAQVRYKSGDFSGAKAFNSSTMISSFCYYESSDCTGTCYLNDSSNTVESTMKDWIIEGNGVYYVTTGSEAQQGGSKTMNSRMVFGQCSTGSWTNNKNIALTEIWQNSAGVSLPLAAPLYFGE